MSMSSTKPPLGIVRRDIYERNMKINRMRELMETIIRYLEQELQVDPEWIKEYNELVIYLNQNKV